MSPVSILQICNCLHLLKQAHTLYSMYKSMLYKEINMVCLAKVNVHLKN